jgi:uncharacterized protein (TIGR02266 family)
MTESIGKRDEVTLSVEYDGADDLVVDFSENLSSGSMFVATERELPVNARVTLVLSFPGLIEPIALDGTVLWTRRHGPDGEAGAGIELEQTTRTRLAAIVERIRNRDPKVLSRLVRVLFVEDNRHVVALIQDGLRAATRREFGGVVAFVFRSAEDGRTAVELLQHEQFDALIVDMYLPVLDGSRVIAHVRGQLGLTDLPIIAVSAGGDAARTSALAAGANVFIDKPMRLRQMIDAIQQLVPANDRPATTVGTRDELCS